MIKLLTILQLSFVCLIISHCKSNNGNAIISECEKSQLTSNASDSLSNQLIFQCISEDSLWMFHYSTDGKGILRIKDSADSFLFKMQLPNQGFDDSKVKVFEFINQNRNLLVVLIWEQAINKFNSILVLREKDKVESISGTSITYDSTYFSDKLKAERTIPDTEQINALKNNFKKNLNMKYSASDTLVLESWGVEPYWEFDIKNSFGEILLNNDTLHLKNIVQVESKSRITKCNPIYEFRSETHFGYLIMINYFDSECGCSYLQNLECGCGFDMDEYSSPYKSLLLLNKESELNCYLGCGFIIR